MPSPVSDTHADSVDDELPSIAFSSDRCECIVFATTVALFPNKSSAVVGPRKTTTVGDVEIFTNDTDAEVGNANDSHADIYI